MATISNINEFLSLLGPMATSADPVAALEGSGHTFAPAFKAQLKPNQKATPAQRQRWAQTARQAGKFTFGKATQPFSARPLAAGEFEFSAGLRMSAANPILAGLYANGTIPDVFFLDQLLSDTQRTVLEGAFVVDKPGGRIGRFQITAAPTLSVIRDGFDRVMLNIPFRLNFEKIGQVATGPRRTVVTFATGTLQLSVGLVTSVVPVTSVARNLEIQIDLSSSADARLLIDANSPVQRTSPPAPNQPDGLAIIIQNVLQQQLASTLRLTVSAAIPLPFGKLEIHQTALITRGDAMLVGIKVQGIAGTGDPQTLVAQFPNAQANYFTRVHDSIIRLLVQTAARNGDLTRIAKQTHPDAVIDSADVVFGTNTINVRTTGKIVDLCPFGVDLGFTVTTKITITLDGTRIIVKKETSTDKDNTDTALCIITTLGLAVLAAVAVIVFQGLSIASGIAATLAFGVVGVLTAIMNFNGDDFQLIFGSGGDNKPTIIPLDFPFPHTDLLPTVSGEFIRVDSSTMLIGGTLGTRADNINSYLYVRFLDSDSLGIARAMPNVTVKLMDRDSPAPTGDDVTLPGPSTVQTNHSTPAHTFTTTKKTHYERTADETFGTGTTDHSGLVRFYIPKDKLVSKAGNKVVETTSLDVDTDKEMTTTSRTSVAEPRPDLYFRVTRANGTVVDTLNIPAGFFLNFQSARVGTHANPLSISFGGVGPVMTLESALV